MPSREKVSSDRVGLLPPAAWTALYKWHQTARRSFPWRVNDPWVVLVAETLLQRTRAATVASIFPRLIRQFPTPCSLAGRAAEWISLVSVLGLPGRRMKFVDLAGVICSSFGGKVPLEYQDLLSLPHVGHYTAGAVRCFSIGTREVIVDVNTLRLARRVEGSREEIGHRTRAGRRRVASLYPNELGGTSAANYALLDLAALVCTPRDPACSECPIGDACAYRLRKLSLESGLGIL